MSIPSETRLRPQIHLPSEEENAKILAAALADPDAQPLREEQLKAMQPLRTLRGRPPSDNKKILVSVRYSPEVIAYFKATGDGWQARMDGVLREYIARQDEVEYPALDTTAKLPTE